MEHHLLRLILSYSFYNDIKSQIPRTVFSKDILELYDIICSTHDKLQKDLSLTELKQLFRANYPVATKAKLDNIDFILDNLPTEVSESVAKEVLKKVWITEAGRQIAQIGIDIVNGKGTSFSKAKEILEKISEGAIAESDDLQQITDDLDEILAAVKTTTQWSYNIPGLSEVASGVGDGIFEAAFGLTECGKTAFAVSLAAAPGGFCDQGGTVNYYGNEEAAIRTKARAVMAYTGMPLIELSLNKDEAKATYAKISPRLRFYECKGRHISELEAHIKKSSPNIVIVDQLDKFSVTGSFAREDERLGELYVRFRDILTRQPCAGIAISQANADAEGKTLLASTNMALARVSKAAECDVLIGIGKSSLHNENTRILNIIKNKISGNHQEVVCQLIPEISRYVG